MKSRRLIPRTADLFAAASQPPAPLLAAQPPRPAASPPAESALRPVSPHASSTPSCRRPLWYAVVFPGLVGAEPAALQRLALHAQRFTSLVSLEPPDALLLEIRGSLKVFGPAEVLHAAIDAVWRGMPVPASSAAAPSTLAALWFARSGRRVLIEDPAALSGRLADLPIACTGWDAERLRSLRAMGVTRLGELLRLPRTGIARRLGSALFDLDIALARLPSVRRAFVPRERFRERCDFDAEVESVDALDRALEPLIGSCCRFLRERQAGVLALLLKLRHRVGPVTRLRLGLASVTGERRRLQEVLTHTLVGLALAAPVRGVELVSGPLQALPAGSLDAFAGSPRTPGCDTAPQLVERLRARLGEASVYGLCSLAEHRPEAARGRVHAPWLAGGPAAGRAHSGIGAACRNGADMPRPLWLLDEPLPLSEQEVRQLDAGGLILEEGPERIESGWWDGKGVARDYYRARRTQGSRLWVFQERHTRRWYVHGVFA